MNDPFGIQQSLKNLGIHESNLGSSTGLNWLDSGAA
jgi:aldehyde dehydrogenase (NAD+)